MSIEQNKITNSGNLSRYTTTVPKRQPRNFSVGGFQMNNQQIRNDGRVNPTPVGKYSTETLEFPLGVASGDPGFGNHGHYIMFYINAQENSQLVMGSERDGRGGIADSSREYNTPKHLKEWDNVPQSVVKKRGGDNVVKKNQNDNEPITKDDIRRAGGIDNLTSVKKASQEKSRSTIRVKRAPTKRLNTAIAMYMPATVQVTYGANYTDTDMGALTEQALNAYADVMAGNYRGARENVVNMDEGAKELMQRALLGTIGTVPGMAGAQAAYEMKQGIIISDRLELAFKGINKRAFQYTFKMIPKNQAEAENIRRIVTAFKFNMMPEFLGGDRGGRRLIVPNTFDIQYMYCNNSNSYLHHISTCVLENMTVSYGGDRYKTFDADESGAPPVETSMTLAFKEMELITRERIYEGY